MGVEFRSCVEGCVCQSLGCQVSKSRVLGVNVRGFGCQGRV